MIGRMLTLISLVGVIIFTQGCDRQPKISKVLIVDGQNGFVVADRDPGLFAAAMARAVKMKIPNDVSLSIAEKYSLANLGNDLGRLWKPLARSVAAASSRSTG